MRRSKTAARRGKSTRRRRIRRSRRTRRARRGSSSRCGRSRPAAPTSRACSGPAPYPAAFSARRIAATRGRSSNRCGTSGAHRMDGRRLRRAGHPFDLRRPARQPPHHRRGVDRRRVANPRPRRNLGDRARGMRAVYMPPERRDDPIVQDVHRMVACRSNPDLLWVQHHNGVFRSTDGAASWQEVHEPALSGFGFAVVVDPNDARHRVVRAGDQGREARSGARRARGHAHARRRPHVRRAARRPAARAGLRSRLPPRARHRRRGRRLAIGSTTGGLWISENRGDSWQCVSAHLPPIYAVRFTVEVGRPAPIRWSGR